MSNSKKHHHFLIVGTILFKVKGQEQTNGVTLNGVLVHASKEVQLSALGKAQQVLQLNFHQSMQDETIEVENVILNNFVYLGEMTKEEFHKPAAEAAKVAPTPANDAPSLSVVAGTDTLEQAVSEAPVATEEPAPEASDAVEVAPEVVTETVQ